MAKIGYGWPVAGAVWLAFMLVVTVSLFIPAINDPAIGILCQGGQHSLDVQNYNPYPGEEVTTYTNLCDVNGVKTDITFPVMYVGFGLYSALFLFIAIILVFVHNLKNGDGGGTVDNATGIGKNRFKQSDTDVFKKM